MKKKYLSLGFVYRTINVTINGVIRIIQFAGGTKYPEKKCGFFITDDEEVQKALESHKGFGKKFVFVGEVGIPRARKAATVIMDKASEVPVKMEVPVEEPIEIKENTDSRDDEAINTQKDVVEAPEETTKTEEVVDKSSAVEEIFEIEKVQDAKEYLMKKFKGEFTHRHLSNKTKVLEVAKEKNIKFPNIK